MATVSDSDNSSWKDGTSSGYLRFLMRDGMTYDGVEHHNTYTLESLIKHLYHEVHLAAVDKKTQYVYNILAHQMPTNYTIEEVKDLLPRYFDECKIELSDTYAHLTKDGNNISEKRLVWKSITIDWSEDYEEEDDEEAWAKCAYLQQSYRREYGY